MIWCELGSGDLPCSDVVKRDGCSITQTVMDSYINRGRAVWWSQSVKILKLGVDGGEQAFGPLVQPGPARRELR